MRRLLIVVLLVSLAFGFGGVFRDVPSNHWAYKAVEYLYSIGVITGQPGGRYDGGKALTRYEAAVMIYRAIRYLESRMGAGGATGDIAKVSDLAKKAYEKALENANMIGALQGDISAIKKKIVDLDVSSMKASMEELNKMKGDIEALIRNFEEKITKEFGEIKDKADQAYSLASQFSRDLNILKRQVAEHTSQIGGLYEDIKKLEDMIKQKAAPSSQPAGVNISDLRDEISSLKRDLNDLIVKSVTLEGKISTQSEALDAVKRMIVERDTEMSNLKASVRGLEDKFDALQGSIAGIVKKTDDLSRKMVGLESRVSKNEEEISELKTRLQDIEAEIENIPKEAPSIDLKDLKLELMTYTKKLVESGMDAKLEELKGELKADVKKAVSSMKSEILDELDQRIASVRDTLTEDISSLKNEIGKLREAVSENAGDISKLKADIEDLTKELGTLSKMKGDFENVLKSFEDLKANFETYSTKYENMSKKVEEKLATFEKNFYNNVMKIPFLESQVSAFKSDVESLKTKLSALEDRVGTLKDTVSRLERDLTTAKTDIKKEVSKEIENRLNGIEVELGDLDKEVKNDLKPKVESLIGRMSDVEKRLDSVESKLADLETLGDQIGKLKTNMSTVSDRISALEDEKADKGLAGWVTFSFLMALISLAVGGAALYFALQ